MNQTFAQVSRSTFRKQRLWIEAVEQRTLLTTLPTGFSESLVASNISSPTAMDVLPDGRVLIAEQGGSLRVVENGALLSTPFLHLDVDFQGERGLIGVTHDPNFATNHFIYVYHTVKANGSAAPFNEVSRFTANGDVAQAGSEVDILKLNDLSSATNHNGGAMHFGPNGFLYIDVGENANPANSQTLGTLLGKVLRIDVSQTQPGDPINDVAKLIPSDNPFTTGHAQAATGINQAIFALGFRNPFTFAVQPGTGTIFINDVGQDTWEEIDKLVRAGNYGWNNSEGFKKPNDQATTIGVYQDPQLAYNHTGGPAGGGIAIVGGAFYNPPAGAQHPFPSSYIGKYFYQDLGGNWIRLFDPANPGSPANPDTSSGFATSTVATPVDMAVAPDGGLYYLARGSSGELLKISYTNASTPSIVNQPANTTIAVGASARFTVTASGPGTLHYQWQRNNGPNGAFMDIGGATASAYALENAQLSDNKAQFRVVVTSAGGSETSTTATLSVIVDTAPVPVITITSGLRNGKFDAGTPINFTLAASDKEDGSEPAYRFTYRVDYVTSLNSTPGGVVRPYIPATRFESSGTFTPATSGPYTLTDVVYRITFTSGDARGLQTRTVMDIAPNTSTISLATNPTGLQLDVDGQTNAAPLSFDSVVGFQRDLDAPVRQSAGGTTYVFDSWSDGGAATHNVTTAPTNTSYTANYDATAAPTLSIDAGGAAAGAYIPDIDFQGGTAKQVTDAIDTSQVTTPAPQAVYQSWREGNATYTVPGLSPGATYKVRLDFSENTAILPAQRVFDVAINGTTVLSNFDIFLNAGGRFRALERDFTATADSSGKIAIALTGVIGQAQINGIEVSTAPAAPVLTSAKPAAGGVALAWNAVAGATRYAIHFGTSSFADTEGSPFYVGNVTNTTVTNLVSGQTYFFWVQAVDDAGLSPNSNELTATAP